MTQVILRARQELSNHEPQFRRCAQRARGDRLDWTLVAPALEQAVLANAVLAVRLSCCHTPVAADVIRSAAEVMRYLGNRDDLRRACGLVGLSEAMDCHRLAVSPDWGPILETLPQLLDNTGPISSDEEFQREVVRLLSFAWEQSAGAHLTRLPELRSPLEAATLSCRLLAEALTSDVSLVAVDTLGLQGICSWLCLAALFHDSLAGASFVPASPLKLGRRHGNCGLRWSLLFTESGVCARLQRAQDPAAQQQPAWITWRTAVAKVAVSAISGARTSEQFIKQAVRVLFSTQRSLTLQKVVFKAIWIRSPPAQSRKDWIGALLQYFDPQPMSVEACRAFCELHLQLALDPSAPEWESIPQWMTTACQSGSRCNLELILRYAVACGCEPPGCSL